MPKWVQDLKVGELVSPKITQYWELNGASALFPVVWDAFKVYSCGEYSSAIKVVRSDLFSQTQQLEDCEVKAAVTFSESLPPDNFGLLVQMRRELSLHLASATHLDLHSLAGKVFESGNKNGKMLANLVAETRTQTVISDVPTITSLLTLLAYYIYYIYIYYIYKLFWQTI